MAVTHTANGWPVLSGYGDPGLATFPIPCTTAKMLLLRSLAPLLVCVAMDWHRTVHPIPLAECYDPRTPESTSNHRSATACDFNSDVFKQHEHVMTPAQLHAADAIVAKYVTASGKRILQLGAHWTFPTYTDEMHVQLSQDITVTPNDVASCIVHLGLTINGPKPKPTPAPVPVPTPALEEDVLIRNQADGAVYDRFGSVLVHIPSAADLKPYTDAGVKVVTLTPAMFAAVKAKTTGAL